MRIWNSRVQSNHFSPLSSVFFCADPSGADVAEAGDFVEDNADPDAVADAEAGVPVLVGTPGAVMLIAAVVTVDGGLAWG